MTRGELPALPSCRESCRGDNLPDILRPLRVVTATSPSSRSATTLPTSALAPSTTHDERTSPSPPQILPEQPRIECERTLGDDHQLANSGVEWIHQHV
jgi:hypothetical protein